MNDLKENINNDTFESIKHFDENGTEFWYARELQQVLTYKEWHKFEGAIKKAKITCEQRNIKIKMGYIRLLN